MAQLTQKQLAALRAEYLEKREQLLIKKVDGLAIVLFEKVYESYLLNLQSQDDKILASDNNYNMVKGLDEIYNKFVKSQNIPVIKGFIKDLQGITPLNERYFEPIRQQGIKASSERVKKIVDKSLGITEDGGIKKDGFADKFIRDKMVLKAIKKETNKALTNNIGFQELRQNLKQLIVGEPELPTSGKLQQYYRNNAYDTFIKVDRLNQDLYAKDLGLRYFIWSGGIIPTSREMCRRCNAKIVDSNEFKLLKYDDILIECRDGLDESWEPMDDLGGFGCRHRKDYILTSVAERSPGRILNLSEISN